MKLTTLKIHRYRDVVPGAELTFHPSLNLALGENGTGRTALLDLVSLVLGSDFSVLRGEEFSVEYALAFPGMEIRARVRNEKRGSGTAPPDRPRGEPALLPLRVPEVAELEPFIELALNLDAPEARLVMRADASGVAWEVDGRPGYSQTMNWSLLDRSLWVLLLMTSHRLEPGVRERLKGLLRRVFLLGPARFDEGLGTFEQIGNTRYAMEMRDGDVFPLGLMALPTWLPARLRERVEREPALDVIEIPHDEVEPSFLSRFVALAGFTRGKMRAELLEKRVFEGGGRLELGSFGFSFTRRDGSVVSQAHLGHGQKRLLAFLYYLDVNEDFVIADELANGLHPRWVEACLREVGERQAFLTSQNPLVFEHVRLESAADVESSLILCGTGLRDGREQRIWANPTAEMAERLFRAYRQGSAPLGELLRAQGMW